MATDWTAPIDAYCERVDASFWSEPVNALSNAAFLVAAVLAFARWRRAGASDRPALFLIAAVAVVGIGSFRFHTFANRWSRLADVIPIAVFIYGYFALAMRRFFGLGLAASVGLTLAFLAVGLALIARGHGRDLAARRRRAGQALLVAACAFVVSLAFRTVDIAFCDAS